jgi:hypothetical protein
MQVGEKRTLFIHPSLGYGALTSLPPCLGLVIKVHLIDFDQSSCGNLPPLQALDLDWVKEPCFYQEIKESIDTRPLFVGSFYGKILDKIEGIDKSALIAEVERQVFKKISADK